MMKLIVRAVCIAVALAPLAAAHAQTTIAPLPSVSVDLQGAPIRAALEQIFRAAKVDFGIAPEVSGFVTLKVTDLPFEAALRLILRSSEIPLTYSADSGIYLVKPRMTTPTVVSAPLAPEVTITRPAVSYDRIDFTYADPADFAGILNIQMIPIFTRFGLNVPGATGILKPGAPGTKNGNGGVVGSGNPPAMPPASGGIAF